MTKVRYEIEVDSDVFPFAPGIGVVVRDLDDKEWHREVFMCRCTRFVCEFMCVKAAWRQCHPIATHGHLLGTTYPADTPACAQCGKARPDCVCVKRDCNTCPHYYDDVFGHCDDCPLRDNGKQVELQPFQRVMVRDGLNQPWEIDHFSRIDEDGDLRCSGGVWYKFVIPYEGHEHILGTTDSPKRQNGRRVI